MLNFGPTFIWVIFNLAVLYIVLRLVLFKPVTRFMENRTNSIQADLASAEKAKAEAEQLALEYRAKLEAAKSEADGIIHAARERAGKEREALIKEAKADAQAILDRARSQIELEREHMLREVRDQVVSLALSAASKVIEANMDTETNRAMVDRFIEEEGAA